MDNVEVLEALIVLEYLELGIMPYYPSSPGINTSDRKAHRKFRKIWRKVANEKKHFKNSSFENYKCLEGKSYPSKNKMAKRKIMVHRWITERVLQRYNV